MYTENENGITITMSKEDHMLLLLALGAVTGLAARGEGILEMKVWVALTNRLNEGNPNFRPYALPE